jgi:hypothetical protein
LLLLQDSPCLELEFEQNPNPIVFPDTATIRNYAVFMSRLDPKSTSEIPSNPGDGLFGGSLTTKNIYLDQQKNVVIVFYFVLEVLCQFEIRLDFEKFTWRPLLQLPQYLGGGGSWR